MNLEVFSCAEIRPFAFLDISRKELETSKNDLYKNFEVSLFNHINKSLKK